MPVFLITLVAVFMTTSSEASNDNTVTLTTDSLQCSKTKLSPWPPIVFSVVRDESLMVQVVVTLRHILVWWQHEPNLDISLVKPSLNMAAAVFKS